jgi:hypothetical protein
MRRVLEERYVRVERAVTAVGRVRRAGRAIVERDVETPCVRYQYCISLMSASILIGFLIQIHRRQLRGTLRSELQVAVMISNIP